MNLHRFPMNENDYPKKCSIKGYKIFIKKMKQFILFTMLFVASNAQTPGFDPIGSYVTDDSCGTQYHKRTIGTCSNPFDSSSHPIESKEDCQLAASAIGNSMTEVNLAAFPQGCYLHESRMVLFNVNVNAKKCDVIGVRFCLCRDSNLHCRSQMGQVPTNTLTPPSYQKIDGIFSPAPASTADQFKNTNHIVVGDSTPFHTEFITSEIEASFKQSTVDVSTKVTTSSLFYISETGRTILSKTPFNVPNNNLQKAYTYKRITESNCAGFGWELIDSAEECKEAARELRRDSEQMSIFAVNSAVFEQNNVDNPKGCYHLRYSGASAPQGRLYYNVGATTADCSGVSGCICKKKSIQNYMVRESGYCTDLSGFTVIPTVSECDFAAKNIPEYLATLNLITPGVIRNIEQLYTVGIFHKVAPPGCFMKNKDLDGLEEISLLFNMDVNPQGELDLLPSVYNDNKIMKPCSATEVCICKRAPYKTIDSLRCDDIAGWQNIEDRPTPSTLDTHDYPGECRKAVEHLSSNSNLLSLSMNMANSGNPQIEGLFPNLGYVSHITGPVNLIPPDIGPVNLLNHMNGYYDTVAKPAGCSIATGSMNAAYNYNRGTHKEVFTMVEYDGQEYAAAPNAVNEVTCNSGRQCVCKRVPEYRRVCAICDQSEPVCLEFQNIDKVTQMEIDWTIPGIYPLGIFDDTVGVPTEYVLEVFADLSWKIGTVTYTDLIRSDTPPGQVFTYEYLVKRSITYTSVFADVDSTFSQKMCNNVLTNTYVFTVDKFSFEISESKVDKRVATSGSCSDFNYEEVSTAANGDKLCQRKVEDNYKIIETGFCESEKGWLPIDDQTECAAVLDIPSFNAIFGSSMMPGSHITAPVGCVGFFSSIGDMLVFNTAAPSTVSQLESSTLGNTGRRLICKRADYSPTAGKQWNDLAGMSLEHVAVPGDYGEIAVRSTVDRPVYDDSIVFREYDGDNENLYIDYRVIDSGECEDTAGWKKMTNSAECAHILSSYDFHALDDTVITVNSGSVDPAGCSLKNQASTGVTMRFNSNTAAIQTCGSFFSSGGTWKFYRCLCKRQGPVPIGTQISSSNLKSGFFPLNGLPMRDSAIPRAGCTGDGCVSLYDVNECLTNPCQNSGVCTESGTDAAVLLGEYNCECPVGTSGTNCEEDINECTTVNPCQNSAVCTESTSDNSIAINDYHCACPAGYTGTNCEIDIDECEFNDANTCLNGGTCTQTTDGTTPALGVFHCDCVTGWTGDRCEEDTDECNTNPSSTYVTHARSSDASFGSANEFSSSCSDVCEAQGQVCNEQMFTDILGTNQGLSGVARSRCQIQVDIYLKIYGLDAGGTLLADGSVQNQQSPQDWICSKCVQIAGEAEQAHSTNPDCQPGVFYGENPTDATPDQHILWWNAALDPINGYTCATKASENVKNIICECTTVNPCQNSAVCTESTSDNSIAINDYHCACPAGYTGTNCEIDTDGCDNEPCLNGAFCTSVVDNTGATGYTCTCENGYSGTNCEEDINECDTNPCQNGATCTETSDGTTPTVGVYHCECVAGFEGYACHIHIPCDTNPCQNGATCEESVVTDPAPTLLDITLQNTCSSYGDGYRGLTADECENVPNTVSMTLYGDGLGVHTYGACAYNGMGGTMLGVIDDSQPDLCFFVTCACLKPVVEYNCECPTGYSGTNCEEDINECALPASTCTSQMTTRCNAAGSCFQSGCSERDMSTGLWSGSNTFCNNNFYSDCDNCYTTSSCYRPQNPCQNGAVCTESDTDSSVALGEYHCECANGYTGTNCNECGPGKGQDSEGVCTECNQPQINNVITHSAPCADQECPEGFGVSSDNWDILGGNCAECPAGEESMAGTGVCSNINECDPNPCLNGAVCSETSDGIPLPGVFHCACPAGYTGTKCEDIDKCDPYPCLNGAACTTSLVMQPYNEFSEEV